MEAVQAAGVAVVQEVEVNNITSAATPHQSSEDKWRVTGGG